MCLLSRNETFRQKIWAVKFLLQTINKVPVAKNENILMGNITNSAFSDVTPKTHKLKSKETEQLDFLLLLTFPKMTKVKLKKKGTFLCDV